MAADRLGPPADSASSTPSGVTPATSLTASGRATTTACACWTSRRTPDAGATSTCGPGPGSLAAAPRRLVQHDPRRREPRPGRARRRRVDRPPPSGESFHASALETVVGRGVARTAPTRRPAGGHRADRRPPCSRCCGPASTPSDSTAWWRDSAFRRGPAAAPRSRAWPPTRSTPGALLVRSDLGEHQLADRAGPAPGEHDLAEALRRGHGRRSWRATASPSTSRPFSGAPPLGT